MLETGSFKSAGKVVRLDNARRGEKARLAASAPHDGPIRSRLTVVPDRKTAGSAKVADDPASPWSWLFTFFMDGFALYGAMVAGVSLAHLRDHTEAAAAPAPGDLQPGDTGRRPVVLSLLITPDNDLERQLGGSRKWLSAACEETPGEILRIASTQGHADEAIWSGWRRERRIRKAVQALAALDDRTLRDIGIADRFQIEWVVRYCHDC
jgi:uncharacterized protein YjiS (DUF1127 family)